MTDVEMTKLDEAGPRDLMTAPDGGTGMRPHSVGTGAPEPARARRAIVLRLGILSMIAGLGVLVYVAYQLWGTGVDPGTARTRLDDELVGLLAEDQVVSSGIDEVLSEARPVNAGDQVSEPSPSDAPPDVGATDETAIGDRASSVDPSAVAVVPNELLHHAEGSVVGRILIPAIGVEQILVEGIAEESLRRGPGHYPTTSLPGLPGNAAIAGHRTTWGAPFNRIDELEPGDRIDVEMAWGTFTYEVASQGEDVSSGHLIVEPGDVWVLDDAGDNRLTLTSCHPKYSARERIVVVARLVGEPAVVDAAA